jgi:hypothetical protein
LQVGSEPDQRGRAGTVVERDEGGGERLWGAVCLLVCLRNGHVRRALVSRVQCLGFSWGVSRYAPSSGLVEGVCELAQQLEPRLRVRWNRSGELKEGMRRSPSLQRMDGS